MKTLSHNDLNNFLMLTIANICQDAFIEALSSMRVSLDEEWKDSFSFMLDIECGGRWYSFRIPRDYVKDYEIDALSILSQITEMAKKDPSFLFDCFLKRSKPDEKAYDSRYDDLGASELLRYEMNKPDDIKSDLGIIVQMLSNISPQYDMRLFFDGTKDNSAPAFMDGTERALELKTSTNISFLFDPITKKLKLARCDENFPKKPLVKPPVAHETMMIRVDQEMSRDLEPIK